MIELEPIESVALTLHHAPGVEALLLGSGISRAAGIPTGWEITVDLIRRLAAVQGISDEPDWVAWYKKRYGSEPSYSDLLDAVAGGPAERRSLIHGYIEAREDEDARKATKAHHAIAQLVAAGTIRVVLTTNFDRLIESALRDVGIEPSVIASDDALVGAVPLVHSRCTIVKLHGDYMDARIRNTGDELTRYSPAMDALLDRVLDEFGLLVVGWSGEWDTALRSAILRSGNRRYPFYWAVRGDLPEISRDLVIHRQGREVPIADADSFFSDLAGKVEALQALNKKHPSSIAMLVAEGKRLCRDERHAPDWLDLVSREVDRFIAFLNSDAYPRDRPDDEAINSLVQLIVARSEALRRLTLVGVRWGNDEAFDTILSALVALTATDTSQSGFTWLISLRKLGASLCFHWALSAAFLREDHRRVARILQLPIPTRSEKDRLAVSTLPILALDSVEWKVLKGYERHHTPHSNYFSAIFAIESREISLGSHEAEKAWDDAEFVIALEFAHLRLPEYKQNRGWFWTPIGRFVWSRDGTSVSERLARVHEYTADSPELKAGLFGGTPQSAKEAADAFSEFIGRVARGWY